MTEAGKTQSQFVQHKPTDFVPILKSRLDQLEMGFAKWLRYADALHHAHGMLDLFGVEEVTHTDNPKLDIETRLNHLMEKKKAILQ